MGKARRARTKYHISSVHGDGISSSESKLVSLTEKEDTKVDNFLNSEDGKCDTDKFENSDWKIVPDDDLFKNVNINVDELETSVEKGPTTKPNNLSISKSIKRCVAENGGNIQLKKGDKRELRRNLFIKKIDAIHQEIFKKKPKKSKFIASGDGNLKEPKLEKSSEEPKVTTLKSEKIVKSDHHLSDFSSGKVSKRKQKTMAKSKNKTQEMLNNIEFFNNIISDANYCSDALGSVTDAIEKRVFSDF